MHVGGKPAAVLAPSFDLRGIVENRRQTPFRHRRGVGVVERPGEDVDARFRRRVAKFDPFVEGGDEEVRTAFPPQRLQHAHGAEAVAVGFHHGAGIGRGIGEPPVVGAQGAQVNDQTGEVHADFLGELLCGHRQSQCGSPTRRAFLGQRELYSVRLDALLPVRRGATPQAVSSALPHRAPRPRRPARSTPSQGNAKSATIRPMNAQDLATLVGDGETRVAPNRQPRMWNVP